MLTITGHIKKLGDVSNARNVLNKISGGTPTLVDESGSSTTNEVKMLGILEHCTRTRGYKEIYYKATTADTIFFGVATDTETSGTYKCFNVRVKGLTITDNPDSKLMTWNATLELTQ